MDGLRELGERRVVQPRRPRPRRRACGAPRRLAAGERLTEALDALPSSLGVAGAGAADERRRRCAPASGRAATVAAVPGVHDPRARGGRRSRACDFRGIEAAPPPPEVLEAIARGRAIVIGPSNPVISIRPILAVPGHARGAARAAAPVVAVSPLVGGAVVKGPTERVHGLGRAPARRATGVAAYYDGLLDGLVADEAAEAVPTHVGDVLMADAAARARVARETLDFAATLPAA